MWQQIHSKTVFMKQKHCGRSGFDVDMLLTSTKKIDNENYFRHSVYL